MTTAALASASPISILAGLTKTPAADPAPATAEAAAAKPTTLAELQTAFPDLCAQLVAQGVAQGMKDGAAAEHARIAGIEAAMLPGHEKIIAAHKADPKMTPADASLAVITAERARGSNHLAALAADESKVEDLSSQATGAGGAPAAGKESAAALAKRASDYQAEQLAKGITVDAIAAVAHVTRAA